MTIWSDWLLLWVASWNKFIIAIWRFVQGFFLQLYEINWYPVNKFMYFSHKSITPYIDKNPSIYSQTELFPAHILWILYIYIYISSSSCRAISTDNPDPLSLPLPIVHRFRQVINATSRIYIELQYVGSSWSAMWRGPQEYNTFELVPASPAVSHMSGSSNFDSFSDGW